MKKTWKTLTAGILAIIAGIVGMVSGAITVGGGALGGMGSVIGFGMMFPVIAGAIVAWGVTQIVFGIIAIVGGNHARNRSSWGWALTGSILAIPLVPPLGVIALIFLVMGKNEFA